MSDHLWSVIFSSVIVCYAPHIFAFFATLNHLQATKLKLLKIYFPGDASSLYSEAPVTRIRFQTIPFSFRCFSNRSTLDCVFKCLRFHDRFQPSSAIRYESATISLRFQMKTYPCNRGLSCYQWKPNNKRYLAAFVSKEK